jgi:hypothetical protein
VGTHFWSDELAPGGCKVELAELRRNCTMKIKAIDKMANGQCQYKYYQLYWFHDNLPIPTLLLQKR